MPRGRFPMPNATSMDLGVVFKENEHFILTLVYRDEIGRESWNRTQMGCNLRAWRLGGINDTAYMKFRKNRMR